MMHARHHAHQLHHARVSCWPTGIYYACKKQTGPLHGMFLRAAAKKKKKKKKKNGTSRILKNV